MFDCIDDGMKCFCQQALQNCRVSHHECHLLCMLKDTDMAGGAVLYGISWTMMRIALIQGINVHVIG